MRWLNIFRCLVITLLILIFIFHLFSPSKLPGNQNENHAHQLNIIIKLNQGVKFAIFNIVNLQTNTKELFLLNEKSNPIKKLDEIKELIKSLTTPLTHIKWKLKTKIINFQDSERLHFCWREREYARAKNVFKYWKYLCSAWCKRRRLRMTTNLTVEERAQEEVEECFCL